MTTLAPSPSMTAVPERPAGRRAFTRGAFDAVYDRSVATGRTGAFLEVPDYYEAQRERYYRTLRHVVDLDLPRPARVLEVGGGQIALLCRELFGDEGVVGDVTEKFAEDVTRHGVAFTPLNLLTDDLPDDQHGTYDLVVLAEVIEHLPVPGHVPLAKVRSWLRPAGVDAAGDGGKALVTTPNLYRLRNVWRLLTGKKIFCNFHFPDAGQCGGHQLEYSVKHLKWQLQAAGLRVDYVNLEQLANHGHSAKARVQRTLARPLFLNPRWRDNLVAVATRTVAPVPPPKSEPW